MIVTKTFQAPPVCQQEILRYAGCKQADPQTEALLEDCLQEVADKLTYQVCYAQLPVTVSEALCQFGHFSVRSEKLARNLKGCCRMVLFGATLGVEIDRLIAKYGRIAPARALLLQAIGAERIEALCDLFCEEIAQETGLSARPRFSPGYGDLPLSVQKDIFSVLDCQRKIGLTLTDSLLMRPSKSVTAFLGLTTDRETHLKQGCSACDKQDCAFRGAL